MVESVRSGQSQRSVAIQFKVSLATVQFWVKRAKDKPLDQVNWEDASHAPHLQSRQTSQEIEKRVLDIRLSLGNSDLGENGAQAIQAHLPLRAERLAQTDMLAALVPSVTTINRILKRNGAFDNRQRIRRTPPLAGTIRVRLDWYLPEVAQRKAEIAIRPEWDETDYIESLYLEGGQEMCALNTISMHGGLCATWLSKNMRAASVFDCLLSHWREFGLPGYAQFDNGNVFTGPRQHPDSIGSVIRLCLSLSVIPVFSLPAEFGIQSAIESYNSRWKQKVWNRFHFPTIEEAKLYSDRYVAAARQKHRQRHGIRPVRESAPTRNLFPVGWEEPGTLKREGKPYGPQGMIFLRRTTGHGYVSLLGHEYLVDSNWCQRMVRCEMDLSHDEIRIFSLRRAASEEQRLLNTWSYRLPDKSRKKSEQLE